MSADGLWYAGKAQDEARAMWRARRAVDLAMVPGNGGADIGKPETGRVPRSGRLAAIAIALEQIGAALRRHARPVIVDDALDPSRGIAGQAATDDAVVGTELRRVVEQIGEHAAQRIAFAEHEAGLVGPFELDADVAAGGLRPEVVCRLGQHVAEVEFVRREASYVKP